MAAPTNAPQAGGWRVTGQTEVTRAIPGGGLTKGVEVRFTTAGGHDGSVFVTDAQYTAENVRTQIAVRAAQMDAIGNLAG